MVKIASAAGAVVLAAAAVNAATINTPASITQCQPTSLQWQGATGTVRINILPGGQVSAAPIQTLPDQTGASGNYVWTVNVASGTNITIAISDGSGTTNYASPLVVLPSSDSSCLNAAASGSSSSGAASSTSAASSSASSAASSSSASRASSSAAPSSSAASSSASRASSSSSAAPAATSSGAANSAAAFSPATAGLSILAAAGALLPFL